MKRLLHILLILSTFSSASAQSLTYDWVHGLHGSTGDEYVQSIYTDASGNVYIAGSFWGSVDFNPSSTTTFTLTSDGEADAFFAKYTNAGALIWAKRLGSTLTDEIYAITADAAQNVYVTGYFYGTVDFDPDAGVSTLTSGGLTDVFFGKFDANGALDWVNKCGAGSNDLGINITTDGSGGVYVIGAFAGVVDFDPLASTVNKTSAGGWDVFFARYENDGDLVWVSSIGSSSDDLGYALAVHGDYVYVGGYYSGDSDFDPGTNVSTGGNIGGTDGFYARYNQSDGSYTGDAFWATIRSTGNDEVVSFAVDETGGALYLSGIFSASTNFYIPSGSFVTRNSLGGTDLFVAKLDITSKTMPWINGVGGTGDDRSNLIGVDPDGSVYSTGYFNSTVDFDPGSGILNLGSSGHEEPYVAKYLNDGQFEWAASFTGPEYGTAGALAVDASGNVYVGGGFQNTSDFDPGSGVHELVSSGATDAFFGKFLQTTLASEPTAQPMVLGFANVTSSGFQLSFNAASGTPDGYLAIYKTGSSPTGSPVDGVTYVYNDVIGDGQVFFSGSGTVWDWSSANPATTYHFDLFAYNGDGAERNYRTVSPLQGSVTTLSGSGVTEPTAQPTNLTFTEITPTGFDFSFTASAGGAAGYIGIRRTTSSPTSIPVDGVSYTTGSTLGDGVVFFVGTGTSYFWENATASTTYCIDVFAYNGSGTSVNYRTTTPLEGCVTTISDGDTTDPVILSNTTSNKVAPNTKLTVTARFQDAESGISIARLYYTASENALGYEDFSSVLMTNTSGDTYTAEIPASEAQGLGVTYYFYVENGAGLYIHSDDYVAAIELTGNGLPIPFSSFGSAQTNYRIVSIPITAAPASVSSILGDDLGETDKSKWRMFGYQNGNATELSASSSLQPKRGYWLIVNSSAQLDTGPGTMPSVSLYAPASITLSQGWNLIGNPYPFDVSWAEILDWNDNPSQVSKLRVYKGSFQDGAELEKFSGGFVMASGAVTLEIPTYKNPSTGRRGARSFTGQPIDANNWEVDLKIMNGPFHYDLGGIGMNEDASFDIDKFDDFTLPRFFEYIELNHHKKFMDFAFSRDVVSTASEYTWDFSVETNTSDRLVELSWDNSRFGDNEKQLVLWDVSQQRPVDMRRAGIYRFDKARSKDFKIFFGSTEFIESQTKVLRPILHDAFPNPVTDRVTFAFSIPESSEAEPVILEVFDLMGRRVSTVLNEKMHPGYHEVVWDAVDANGLRPARGVYVSYLRIGNSKDQYRVVIK